MCIYNNNQIQAKAALCNKIIVYACVLVCMIYIIDKAFINSLRSLVAQCNLMDCNSKSLSLILRMF